MSYTLPHGQANYWHEARNPRAGEKTRRVGKQARFSFLSEGERKWHNDLPVSEQEQKSLKGMRAP